MKNTIAKNAIFTLVAHVILVGAANAEIIPFTFDSRVFDATDPILAFDDTGTRQLSHTGSFVDNGTTVNVQVSVGSLNPTFSDAGVVGLERLGSTFGIGDPIVTGIGDTELADTESLVFTFDNAIYLSGFSYGVPNAASGVEVTIDGVIHQFGELYGDGSNGGPETRVFSFSPLLASANSDVEFRINGSTSGPGTLGTIGALQISTVPEPSSTAILGLGVLGLIVRRRRGKTSRPKIGHPS